MKTASTGLSSHGWVKRGGGFQRHVHVPAEWRGTSVQVCGLWPFSAGSGTPMIGVPLGRHLMTGATVCCDPISWFQRASLITNPSMFVLGKPGLGKSSLVRHMVLGLAGFGVNSMILGDLKPDYVDLVEALGGQVIRIGRGRGTLNPLDTGAARDAARVLTGQARTRVMADAHGRRLSMLSGLIQIIRGTPISDREGTILDRCLRAWDGASDEIPTLADILAVLHQAPDEVRRAALDRGETTRYLEVTEPIEAFLVALLGGRFGEVFAGQTTTPMMLDRSVVFDVSSIESSDLDLQAAVLMACWSYGFGSVNVANDLADAGQGPTRRYFIVMDELWRALRAGSGMVNHVDSLTRLNRQVGVGQAMLTHTMSDLEALPFEEDRAKARGFVERAGLVACGGLPQAEMSLLTRAVPLSEAEQAMLVGWATPPAWDSTRGEEAPPPGLGKFLLKVGGRPGIPLQVMLTESERRLNDTNKRWHRVA